MFFLVLLLFLLVGGIVAVITIENLKVAVHLTLFGWQTPDVPIGLLILGSFLLGALLLYAVAFLSARSDRGGLRKLQKRVEELEHQQTLQQRPTNTPFISPAQTTSALQMPGMFTPPKY